MIISLEKKFFLDPVILYLKQRSFVIRMENLILIYELSIPSRNLFQVM